MIECDVRPFLAIVQGRSSNFLSFGNAPNRNRRSGTYRILNNNEVHPIVARLDPLQAVGDADVYRRSLSRRCIPAEEFFILIDVVGTGAGTAQRDGAAFLLSS